MAICTQKVPKRPGRNRANGTLMVSLQESKSNMGSCCVEHCMMAGGIIDELMPSFKSGIGRYDDQVYDIRSVFLARFCLISLYDIHHFAPDPDQRGGGQTMKMQYLPTTMTDFSSGTCLGVARRRASTDQVQLVPFATIFY